MFPWKWTKWTRHFKENGWQHLLPMIKIHVFKWQLEFWKTGSCHHELDSLILNEFSDETGSNNNKRIFWHHIINEPTFARSAEAIEPGLPKRLMHFVTKSCYSLVVLHFHVYRVISCDALSCKEPGLSELKLPRGGAANHSTHGSEELLLTPSPSYIVFYLPFVPLPLFLISFFFPKLPSQNDKCS